MTSAERPIRLAGVLARHRGRVALVRESHEAWGGTFWSIPSGHVEASESPELGATRELQEETGLIVSPLSLKMVSTVSVQTPSPVYFSWNFTVKVDDPALEPSDPDGLITDVEWFAIPEAARLLAQLPYLPLSQPSIAVLTERVTAVSHWAYPTAGQVATCSPGQG